MSAAAGLQLLEASRRALAWFDHWIKEGGSVSSEMRAVRLALMAAIAAAEAQS